MSHRISRSSVLICLTLLVLSPLKGNAVSATADDPPESVTAVVTPTVSPDSENLVEGLPGLFERGVCPKDGLGVPAPIQTVDQCATCTPSIPCPPGMCRYCAGGPYCNSSTQCTCQCIPPCFEPL